MWVLCRKTGSQKQFISLERDFVGSSLFLVILDLLQLFVALLRKVKHAVEELLWRSSACWWQDTDEALHFFETNTIGSTSKNHRWQKTRTEIVFLVGARRGIAIGWLSVYRTEHRVTGPARNCHAQRHSESCATASLMVCSTWRHCASFVRVQAHIFHPMMVLYMHNYFCKNVFSVFLNEKMRLPQIDKFSQEALKRAIQKAPVPISLLQKHCCGYCNTVALWCPNTAWFICPCLSLESEYAIQ